MYTNENGIQDGMLQLSNVTNSTFEGRGGSVAHGWEEAVL